MPASDQGRFPAPPIEIAATSQGALKVIQNMPLPPSSRLLLLYFLVYFVVGVVLRVALVRKWAQVDPKALDSSTPVHAYVGRALQLIVVVCGMVVAFLAAAPSLHEWLGPYSVIESHALAWLGWAILIATLPWIVVAQSQMGRSWRVSIDQGHKTDLVQVGLFSVSRNPIFLAMRMNMLGLFMVVPSSITLALFVALEVMVQVQVRLEEQFLTASHGMAYETYCQRVRRWL